MPRKKNNYNGWEIMRQKRLEETKEQRAILSQRQKEIRQYRKEYGLCTRCGQEYALNGMVLCASCRLYNNQSRSGYVRHSLKWIEKERKAGRV